jgi:hypothetical protein
MARQICWLVFTLTPVSHFLQNVDSPYFGDNPSPDSCVLLYLPQINPALGSTQAFSTSALHATITSAYRIMSRTVIWTPLTSSPVLAFVLTPDESSARVSDVLGSSHPGICFSPHSKYQLQYYGFSSALAMPFGVLHGLRHVSATLLVTNHLWSYTAAVS